MPDRPTLSEKLRAAPLLRVLVPMVAGIAAGTYVAVPPYVWIIATAICTLTAWLALKRTAPATLYAGLAILFFGAALACVHLPRPVTPQGERLSLEVRITDPPARRGRSAHTSGIVTATGEHLLVSFDTMWRFATGDRVKFLGYVNPVSGTVDSVVTDSYSRLMRSRGYVGRTYISQYSRPEVTPSPAAGNPAAWSRKLQSAATSRLRKLGVDKIACKNVTPFHDALAVAAAMTTGDRTGITPALRQSYSHTGAAHLLAVSGLHVGIVFLIVNALLYLLPLARGGHIAKNIAAVAAIWFYAALTGLSPSATRAAFMFTGAQIALATSQTRGAVNTMCGTALVMLAVRPGLLFDISFQLSFIAVASIFAWFAPLYRLVESRWRLLNALWAALVIGLVASVGTMPLVSHTFGVFSPVGVVLNPLVVTTAHLTVASSLVWIALPLPLSEPLLRWLVFGPAWLQNRVVELTSSVPGAAVEWTMPLWMVFAVYAAMIIFTAWIATRRQRTQRIGRNVDAIPKVIL